MRKRPENPVLSAEIYFPNGKVVILSQETLVYVGERGVMAKSEKEGEFVRYRGFPTKITYKSLPE